jgi:hypothetical protein
LDQFEFPFSSSFDVLSIATFSEEIRKEMSYNLVAD